MKGMNKKSFYAVLVLVVLSLPGSFTSAATPSEADNVTMLTAQVHAAQNYLKKIAATLNHERATAVNDEILRNSIQEGISWLQEAQEENGHFAYEYLPYEDIYRNDDNIVRQAGALYIQSEVVRRDTKIDTQANESIERAITFFEGLSTEHTYEGTNVRCVVKSEESNLCKLGATALALTGILGYVEAHEDKADEYEELIDGYVAFILKSKKINSGFRDEYRVGIGFKAEKESSFSNGEALLALVRYYQYKPDTEVKKVIDDTFVYLEGKEFDTALYLWIMAALKDMQVLWPNPTYITYGKEFTAWRMSGLAPFRNTIRNYCAATEGLVSAYSLLEGKVAVQEQKKLRQEIDFWNAKNLALQIGKEDAYRLVNEKGKFEFKEVKNMEQTKGGFLTADDELTQRIDFTQHCVSTHLQTLVDVDGKSL